MEAEYAAELKRREPAMRAWAAKKALEARRAEKLAKDGSNVTN